MIKTNAVNKIPVKATKIAKQIMKEKLYPCNTCQKQFTCQSDVNTHIISEHILLNKKDNLQCNKCDKMCCDKRDLDKHILSNHLVTSDQRDSTSNEKEDLKTHSKL